MTRLRHLGQAQRALFMFALVAILFARFSVPQGWMPSSAGQWITICSEMGVQAAWVDSDGKINKDAPTKADTTDCGFASAGVLDVPTTSVIAARPVPTPIQISQPFYLQIGQGLAAPPPPATGPPSLA